MNEDDEDDDCGYESGPYCSHWIEMGEDCEEICKCGHMCGKHSLGSDCNVEGCDCEGFKDPEKPA